MELTDSVSASDAYRTFDRDRLWALFDGDRERLNIAHECLDRHPPERDAVTVVRAGAAHRTYTFGDLSEWSSRFASWLAGRGVGPGERVAVMLEPSLAFYAAVFGSMKAGAVAVPLFTLFGPDGLRLRHDDCEPALLLAEPETLAVAREVAGERAVCVDDALLEEIAGCPGHLEPSTTPGDLALLQYTSGTTRERPEAVPHTHRAVVTVALAALYGLGIRPGDRFFCPSSPAWGHGMWHGTIAPLALGVETGAFAGRFDPACLLDALTDLGVTNLAAASTHFRMLGAVPGAAERGFRIEKVSFTGEPMDGATAAFVETAFGAPACSMYGTTETGVILVNFPGAPDFEVRPGALGKPMPGTTLEIHDRSGRRCPPGVTGEIVLRRRGAWFPTRDLGHVDEDGYFYHHGRADDVIVSAGWTMSPVEIEDTLMAHPAVSECAAIGVPDALRGQIVKAFVVLAPDHRASADLADALESFTRERLSRHEFPRRFAFVTSLPKTPAGKINRRALREREASGPGPDRCGPR